ncbi:MAG: hypothetical protein ABI995_09675 [Acidobacteriota bacterium]
MQAATTARFDPTPTSDQRQRILTHLDEVLDGAGFSESPRRQEFLRYVVHESLAGRGAAIKERNLAVDVFGRKSDFDGQSASIVRVTGSEVRKRLAQAYAARPYPLVRIELPLGGYQPVFHFADEEAMPQREPAAVPPFDSPVPRRGLLRATVLGLLGAVTLALLLRGGLTQPREAADQFWQPFLNPAKPVLITLTVLTIQRSVPQQSGVSIPSDELSATDTSYVGTGGALGAARFAEQLAFRKQPFQLKFGSDVAFSDLKVSPAILLGPTRWTEDLLRPLRFRIQRGTGWHAIVDAQDQKRVWKVQIPRQASELAEGYALVSRLLNSESGHPILLVVGMDPRDTQAAVEFLSNRQLLESFAKTLPADWGERNFQVVLHNTIHGNSPGALTVVASNVW